MIHQESSSGKCVGWELESGDCQSGDCVLTSLQLLEQDQPMSSTDELYQIADELRSIASLGLNFTQNPYDVERYERILAASA
jgi:hypothetical protein